MSINKRLRELIETEFPVKNRFGMLEKISNIPENSWRTWHTRNSAPNALMIESMCKHFPQFAFWLVTGISDNLVGHVSPALFLNGGIDEITKKYLAAKINLTFNYLNENSTDIEVLQKTEPLLKQMRLQRICEALQSNEI